MPATRTHAPPAFAPADVRPAAAPRRTGREALIGSEGRFPMQPTDPDARLSLYQALAPLVTDVQGPGTHLPEEIDEDPFQALVADVAIQQARESETPTGIHRHPLLRAIAELAETHAVTADLMSETAPIDLPLDLPDPAGRDERPLLVIPDMVRACRDRLSAHMSERDRERMDVVATLFDHIMADTRLATDVRNTLARLQLPVLRMAFADESFFTSRTHPTRRLLDRLAASAAEWQDDTPSARAGLSALDRLVHNVIRGSFEDAGEHARLLEQFERAIVELSVAASSAPVEPVLESEDRDVLVIKATIQISQLLAGVDVDREVRFFLLDVWSRVIVEIACLPPDSRRDALLARAKRLCFDLAWAAAPKTTSGERARLAGLLPTMIAAIRDGLRVIDYPAPEEKRFFGEFTRVLLVAVRGAPGAPFRANDAGADALTIDVFARRLREGSFGIETTIETSPPAEVPQGLRTANDVTPTSLRDSIPPPDGAYPDATQRYAPVVVEELKKGEWFDLRTGDDFTRVRLSWVSPLRSFYLFIGANSALTRSLDPDVIRTMVATGDLRRAAVRKDD
jgi:hypothetical protein